MNIITRFNYNLRGPEFAEQPLRGVVSHASIAGDSMVLDAVFCRGRSHLDMYRAANGEANATITTDRHLPYFALYASSLQKKGHSRPRNSRSGFCAGP